MRGMRVVGRLDCGICSTVVSRLRDPFGRFEKNLRMALRAE
jgi:hypothetical protein